MDSKVVIDRFYDNVMIFSDFIEDLITGLNKKGYTNIPAGILSIAIGMLREYNRTKLIQGFIRKSHLHWLDILEKDDSSISDNAIAIFSAVPSNYVSSFNEIFRKKDKDGNLIITAEQREVIWSFLHPFIKISIKYIHEQQNPYLDVEGKRRYKKRYADEEGAVNIDVIKAAADWGIKLVFT